jgi:hypothetical protein
LRTAVINCQQQQRKIRDSEHTQRGSPAQSQLSTCGEEREEEVEEKEKEDLFVFNNT